MPVGAHRHRVAPVRHGSAVLPVRRTGGAVVAHLQLRDQRLRGAGLPHRALQRADVGGVVHIDEGRRRRAVVAGGVAALHEHQMPAGRQRGRFQRRGRGLGGAVEAAVGGLHRLRDGAGRPRRHAQPRAGRGDGLHRRHRSGAGVRAAFLPAVVQRGEHLHRRARHDQIRLRAHLHRIRPQRPAVGRARGAQAVAQRREIGRQDGVLEAGAVLEERRADFVGEGRQAQFTVGEIVGGAVGGVQPDRGLRGVVVEVGHAPAEGLQRGGVRGGRGGEAPRPQHQPGIAVQVEEHTLRVGVGRIGQGRAASVREGGPDVVDDGLRFRLGRRRRAAEGVRTGAAAAAAPVAPLERVVAVEVDAGGVAATTVVGVVVLAPGQAGLGALAVVGIGLQQRVHLVVVQQPGGVGVGAVALHQRFDQPRGQLGRGVLAGMHRRHDEHRRLRPGQVAVGDARHFELVAAHAIQRLPRRTDRQNLHQIRCSLRQRRHRGLGFLHGAVAGVAADAGQPRALERELLVDRGGGLRIGLQAEADGLQARAHRRVGLQPQQALGAIDLGMAQLRRDAVDQRRIVEPRAHHLRLLQRLRRGQPRTHPSQQQRGSPQSARHGHGSLPDLRTVSTSTPAGGGRALPGGWKPGRGSIPRPRRHSPCQCRRPSGPAAPRLPDDALDAVAPDTSTRLRRRLPARVGRASLGAGGRAGNPVRRRRVSTIVNRQRRGPSALG